MKRKYIILTAFIGLGLLRLFISDRNITLFDIIMSIGVALIIWGIFVWGYDNPEEKSAK